MIHHCFLAAVLLWSGSDINFKVSEASRFLAEEVLTQHEDFDPTLIFTVSIGAPEYIRFSELSDLMEVQALRLMYEKLGSDEIDFSVGYFQMKPSFIEALETRLTCNDALASKYQSLLEFSSESEAVIRSERIDRILDSHYCLWYLQAFADVMNKEHGSVLACLSTKEKLRYLATAYNLGFGYSPSEIIEYQEKQNFPYGHRYRGEQYAFGELSVSIYDQLNKLLCISNW